MELLKQEVESSTGIQLKIFPSWLISDNYLRDQQETKTKQSSAIVITVKIKTKRKQPCASGLRFDRVVKGVKKILEGRIKIYMYDILWYKSQKDEKKWKSAGKMHYLYMPK